MFRQISIISFVIVLGAVFLHGFIFPVSGERKWRPVDILKRIVHLVTLCFIEQKLTLIGALRKLIYLLALFSFLVLAVTGFYGQLVRGEEISGYLLMVHVTFGGILAFCLTVLAVMWSENCRFDKNYFPRLHKILNSHCEAEKPQERYELIRKFCYWLIVVLALPLILSVILSMFKFFGTDWQQVLAEVHRYIALALVLIVIIHTYLLVRFKIKQDG